MSKKFLFVNVDGDYEISAGAYESVDFINVSVGAADSGKPIVLDVDGKIDASMIDSSDIDPSQIDHDLLDGVAASTAHTAFPLLTGTRAFTGDQSMGGNKITNLADPTAAQDAVTKAYADAVATGLRPHDNCHMATTANIDLALAPATIDGVTVVAGDRILVKDQTAATENGIYDYVAAGSPMTRSEDFDNSPIGEIYNGAFIPVILDGTVNKDVPFVLTSIGTGVDDLHIIGTDDIIFSIFTSPTQLQAGDGIDITTNVVSVDLLASGGLKIVGAELAIEPNDIVGEGLVDDGSDNLAIDWSTAFNDARAVKAEDINSVANGEGASIVGLEDANGNTDETNVEGAIDELYSLIGYTGAMYTASGAITKGDLVYISANDSVSTFSSIISSTRCIGIALETVASAAQVRVLANDNIITGILSGATAGTKYFWNGTAWQAGMPSTASAYVYMGGIAANATDLHVEVEYVKKNHS